MEKHLKELFRDTNKALLDAAKKDLDDQNELSALKALHAVKGAALLLGASRLISWLAQAENEINSGQRRNAKKTIIKAQLEINSLISDDA